MKKNGLFYLLCFLFSLASQAEENKYTSIQNVSYRTDSDPYIQERCKLDLYYPTDSNNFATVVWLHGGGLSSGNKYFPEELKNSGLAIASVNYRLLPQAQLSDCIDDAAAAVAWIFQEIEKYGGNRNKIFVAGHSAGGYLTNMIGLDKKWLDKYDMNADSIAGLIPFSGHAISHFAYRQAKGMKDTQPSIDEFAPIYYVRADSPPLILISGDRELELLGRYEENAYFWRMMKVVAHPNTYLYELDGYNHGEMVIPGFHILKKHISMILASQNLN